MSKEYLKVEGYDNLVRDNNSHAIINTDKSAYHRAVARAKAPAKERDEIRNNAREINNLKCKGMK